jgi:hypothetical protein
MCFTPKYELPTSYKALQYGSVEPNYSHKLYVFLTKDMINNKQEKALIYIKVPYIMNRDVEETLSIFMHLIKLLSDKK